MSSSLILVVAVVLALFATESVVAPDPCNKYPTCAQCVAATFCGWCSQPVVYANGDPPAQCAGSTDPFICNGIYSTETCKRGYECDTTNYTCVPSAPGGGVPLNECESNCSTTGKTFMCDNSTWKCVQAPAGHGTSFDQCEAACQQSHAPQSHHPVSPHPASNHPSSPGPNPTPTVAPTYLCNGTLSKCYKAAPGQGSSLSVCQTNCKPSNHTPTDLLGLWRAFPIDDGDAVHEYDLDFHKDNTVSIYTPSYTATCNIQSIGTQELWFIGCSTPQPNLKCIWETSLTMPETYHAMIACNFNGGAAPGSFDAAMTAGSKGGVAVEFLSRCVPDGFCQFHFGKNGTSSISSPRHILGHLLDAPHNNITDPCYNYGANCSYCLQHQHCGWCSTNVQYEGGIVGTRCAGFDPAHPHQNPFVCSGSYSTEMCLPGWACQPANQTCTPTTPGDGVPKQDCIASCKAKPGPPSELIGNWRGLVINQKYPVGAIQVNITATSFATSFEGKVVFQGTIKHVASTVFITATIGPNKGSTLACIWSSQENELVQYIEMACGGFNLAAPTDYKKPMQAPGSEVVLAKCASAHCNW